ncbi:MAG: pyridoxamine 5'-phosphate oxidase [Neptunomonas phycophila]|uniref:pyridoxamine 5'-phosphate oxidase n=1 Tax=Neptunomonas phycophila TaxID=1572645 RepID=UPI003B8CE2C2
MAEEQGDLTALRREYLATGITKSMMKGDPIAQFADWFAVARQVRPDDVSSMTLATADKQGRPSARIVLLKHFDESGFAWYTDYESQKGQALADNPYAEILFYWYGLERQIRIQGRVEKLLPEQADHYFNSRPLGSRLSAHVSHQSHPVASREVLEAKVEDLAEHTVDDCVARPARWGGYRLIPEKFEFWQGRESRLHDRLIYTRNANNGWDLQRIQP